MIVPIIMVDITYIADIARRTPTQHARIKGGGAYLRVTISYAMYYARVYIRVYTHGIRTSESSPFSMCAVKDERPFS